MFEFFKDIINQNSPTKEEASIPVQAWVRGMKVRQQQ